MKNEVNAPIITKFGFQENECSVYPPTYGKLKKLVTTLSHMPVFPGNLIDFYSTGEDKFAHLLADMEKAQNHIHILY
ncbi:MAG: hypothetical protein LIP01_04530, partial [Tannerellaceae bacterium]|nr:hypothetical protein [Tannerellaceae bacterium]